MSYPQFLTQTSLKKLLKESDPFSVSTVTIYTFKLTLSDISNISEFSLPPARMNLFFTYAVFSKDISLGRVFFNLIAEADDDRLLK